MDNMILDVEKPKCSPQKKKKPVRINKFSKAAGYKIDTRISCISIQ